MLAVAWHDDDCVTGNITVGGCVEVGVGCVGVFDWGVCD